MTETTLATFAIPWWIIALGFVVGAIVVIKFLKNFLVNAALGVLTLFVINFFGKEYGLNIAINIVSVVVSAVFGLAGVGALIILKLLGISV